MAADDLVTKLRARHEATTPNTAKHARTRGRLKRAEYQLGLLTGFYESAP